MKSELNKIKSVIQNGLNEEFEKLFNRNIMISITGIGNNSFVNVHLYSFKSAMNDKMKDYMKKTIKELNDHYDLKTSELASAAYDGMGFSIFYTISKEKLMELYILLKMKYPYMKED